MTSSPEYSSPITPELVVSGAVGISEVVTDGADVYWAENRPSEGGRCAIVRWRDGETSEVTGPDVNVRTRVHEYGGGAWWVADGLLVYTDDNADGELFALDVDSGTVTGLTSSGHRYADGRITSDGSAYVVVRERHDADGVHNEIVRVALDGSGAVDVLHSGHDFYGSPRPSPDGSELVAVAWDHPDMPWDRTMLLHGALTASGWDARILGGTGDESLVDPSWGADGRLLVVSDRNDWWNLYEVDVDAGTLTPVVEGDFELATPPWVFGGGRYVDTADGLALATSEPAGDRLLLPAGRIEARHSTVTSLRAHAGAMVAYAASSFSEESAVWLHDGIDATRLSRPRDLGLGPEWFPPPETIEFDVEGERAHGLFYAPANPEHDFGPGLPPLRVMVHGGPTSAARRMLQLAIRYWTSRGIAVVDVDYRGSTLYGRSYRNALRGGWGELDVLDCVAAARHLARAGRVDADRMVITGGSAGGLTVLNALIHHDVFAGGICRYPVTDLAALADDTHKFESRYLDRLVGVLPENGDVFERRSPIHHADQLRTPLLVLQGLDDKVVPPSQPEALVAAMEANGVPVTYITFAGEGHGFRSAEAIMASLRAEEEFITAL